MRKIVCVAVVMLLAGCNHSTGSGGNGNGNGGSGGSGGGGGIGGGGSGGSGGGTLAVALPQALDGALWADPDVYPLLPLRIIVGSVVFAHARFVAGTSDLMETTVGSNVILVWVDERHGNGIANPKPELYFETAWF